MREVIVGTVTREPCAIAEMGGALRLFLWTGTRHVWIDPRNVREILKEGNT